MNEQFELALTEQDTTIGLLTSKIKTAEVVREQMSRLAKENKE